MDVSHLGFLTFHVFNTWLSHGMTHSHYLYGNHHLVECIVILGKKSYFRLLNFMLAYKGEIALVVYPIVLFGDQRGEKYS